VGGEALAKSLHDDSFGLRVDLGHEVGRAFFAPQRRVQQAGRGSLELGSLPRGGQGHVDQLSIALFHLTRFLSTSFASLFRAIGQGLRTRPLLRDSRSRLPPPILERMSKKRKRVFSGIQPSGEAHLGNYLGAIRTWVSLLDEYECFVSIVDLHAITQPFDAKELPDRIMDLAVSLIASGLDPERCTLFVQSDVPEHTELAWLLNTVTPLGELSRMTQFKEKSGGSESVSAGLFNYPVLQAADILLYHGDLVPVGSDQLQHLELTREIARRWNSRFGMYFPEPQPLIGTGHRVLGLDGVSKMSKSQGNTIPLLADAEEIGRLISTAVTDPARKRRDDPGNPHVCNIFALHDFFTSEEERDEIEIRCQTATIGCVQCKRKLASNLADGLAPIQEKARELKENPERVHEALAEGARRASRIARQTLAEARERMGLKRTQATSVAASGGEIGE
jgi:tryptophanyl-tRNA synthetase